MPAIMPLRKKKCCSNLNTAKVTTIMLQFHMYHFDLTRY